MLPWTKRWRDWVRRDLWPLSRLGPQPRRLRHSYEKSGLVVADQPIPWNADAVVVEAVVRVPGRWRRRELKFQLRLPGQAPVPAPSSCRPEREDHFHLTFRLPALSTTALAELLLDDRVLGFLTLPVLSKATFLAGLHLRKPTLFVRLGQESVACQTFVTGQSRGLLAGAVLDSPTCLAPLLDFDLRIEFHCLRTGQRFRTPLCLSRSQLSASSAILSAVPRRLPRRSGTWVASWLVGDHLLFRQRIRGISVRRFHESLRIADTRFVVQAGSGAVRLTKETPLPDPVDRPTTRVAPCFMVVSNEPGMAGLCPMRVTAHVTGAVQPPLLMEQQVLLGDGPTSVSPGLLEAVELGQVTGFELVAGDRSLGTLALSMAPAATFTNEGAFRAPSDYHWTPAAEEEMNKRLARLFDQPQQAE